MVHRKVTGNPTGEPLELGAQRSFLTAALTYVCATKPDLPVVGTKLEHTGCGPDSLSAYRDELKQATEGTV